VQDQLAQFEAIGYGNAPVCIAKAQYRSGLAICRLMIGSNVRVSVGKSARLLATECGRHRFDLAPRISIGIDLFDEYSHPIGQRLRGLPFLHGPPHVLNGPVVTSFDHAHP